MLSATATIIVLLLSYIVVSVSLLLHSLPVKEYDALYELYNNTEGKSLQWETPYTVFGYPWNFTTPKHNPCSSENPWQGVECSSTCETQPCNVIEINLKRHGLKGNLPESIGNFSVLQFLYLDENQLTGQIPLSLGNLTVLKEIYLNQNDLTGSIPEIFANAQKYFVSDTLPTEEEIALDNSKFRKHSIF
jgi:Leucine-rich repeat (LRR) protein